ncbi:MAG: bleomycin resistance protein [Pseudorhodobacter sp.]
MPADRITANLPARDFDATEAFYARMGFSRDFRDDGWMILKRGDLELEFFPHPEVDSRSSWFSACIRVDDLDGFHAEWQKLGLPADRTSIPRITSIMKHPNVPRMFAIIDEDGSLLRILENED